jgi:hypothetical protein
VSEPTQERASELVLRNDKISRPQGGCQLFTLPVKRRSRTVTYLERTYASNLVEPMCPENREPSTPGLERSVRSCDGFVTRDIRKKLGFQIVCLLN